MIRVEQHSKHAGATRGSCGVLRRSACGGFRIFIAQLSISLLIFNCLVPAALASGAKDGANLASLGSISGLSSSAKNSAGSAPSQTTGEPVLIKQTPVEAPPPAAPAVTQSSSPAPGKSAALPAPASSQPVFPQAALGSQGSNSAVQSLPGSGTTATPGTQQAAAQPSSPPVEDSYPTVGKMETVTFGAARPTQHIEERLANLEMAVFKKTFDDKSLFDRTQDLKVTLLGAENDPAVERSRMINSVYPDVNGMQDALADEVDLTANFFEELAERPENNKQATKQELEQFAMDLINIERSKLGVPPLIRDEVAHKVAADQLADLMQRNVVSHLNAQGDNPDRRYTLAGGNDAVTESLISLMCNDTLSQSSTRRAVIRVLEMAMNRQDDRDALMSPEATHIGFSMDWTMGRRRLISIAEVVTKHGLVHPLASESQVGDKVEVKGAIMEPYHFEKISLAWEGNHSFGTGADESEEALPYFPPLDYVAYAQKSDKDYSGAITTLRTIGVVAAIAGGVFMPPVALAAPLIALSGGLGDEPKPASDIPIHGGVKLDGQAFSVKIPLAKDNKDGIYYVTVWASSGDTARPIAISRRAIVCTAPASESVSASVEGSDGSKDGSNKGSKDLKAKSAKKGSDSKQADDAGQI